MNEKWKLLMLWEVKIIEYLYNTSCFYPNINSRKDFKISLEHVWLNYIVYYKESSKEDRYKEASLQWSLKKKHLAKGKKWSKGIICLGQFCTISFFKQHLWADVMQIKTSWSLWGSIPAVFLLYCHVTSLQGHGHQGDTLETSTNAPFLSSSLKSIFKMHICVFIWP